MKKAIFYGVLSALFFAFTFIFNRNMNLTGGYWMWSAILRYVFTLPMLFLFIQKNRGYKKTLDSIKRDPLAWLLWSTVGFGLFYAPLTMASIYGESWFVAASWQLTIVAGVLLTPLFGQKLPLKNLLMSGIILVGVLLLQIPFASEKLGSGTLTSLGFILIAAFSYPLGNRKMMVHCAKENLSTSQRAFGMTLMSMPFWILLSGVAILKSGLPSLNQLSQSLIVALFSGVIATLLFFEATSLVKDNQKQLAVVEATQSTEVLFTLIGGCVFLGDALPSTMGFIGIGVIIIGMVTNSLISSN